MAEDKRANFAKPEKPEREPANDDAEKLRKCRKAQQEGLKHSKGMDKSLRSNKDASAPKETFKERFSFKCPVTDCLGYFTGPCALSHILGVHSLAHAKPIREVFHGEKTEIYVRTQYLTFRNTFCVGVLVYGGQRDKPETLPGQRDICPKNIFLPRHSLNYQYHLPIAVMACCTTYAAFAGDIEHENMLNHLKDSKDLQILVIWLTTLTTDKRFFYTITTYGETASFSKSQIIATRSITDSQNPSEFLDKDVNHFILRNSQVYKLTNRNAYGLTLEIIVHEYPDEKEDEKNC